MASYIEPDEDPSLHRLEGSDGQKGGLIIMKKKACGDDAHTFKKPALPKVSLLGLDRLAKEKRKALEEEDIGKKRSKVSSYKDEVDDDNESDDDDDDEADENQDKSKTDKTKR